MTQISTLLTLTSPQIGEPATPGQTVLLNDYTDRLQKIIASSRYDEAESSLNLPSDQALLESVVQLVAKKVTPALKYHIVVGIGGSNLGTKAVYDALLGCSDILEPERFPKLLFAETTSAHWLNRLSQLLSTLQGPEQILVTLISKSGGTTETLANFEIIMQALARNLGDSRSRVVAITDEGSALWDNAGDLKLDRLALPKPVGGRYSVLSAVGLFPLASVGIDITALRTGAATLRDQCLAAPEHNLAAQSASALAYYNAHGYHINDNFFFEPQLESIGKWYRQLMGESIGKTQSLTGKTVHAGITPTVSLGSTDLHSVGQLYLGGPKDKFTTFISSRPEPEVSVPKDRLMPKLVPMISGKSAGEIMTAILQGTKIAYQKAGLPFMEVKLETIDELHLGAYLQFKMIEMMYLGQLLGVNSFDQPSVEDYKIETKRILQSK